MSANLYDRIKTTAEIKLGFGNRMIPIGTIGTIVECYHHPKESYAVDLTINDDNGGDCCDYENMILYPEQFTVVSETQESENLISLFGGTHYEVPAIVLEQSAASIPVSTPVEPVLATVINPDEVEIIA